MSSRCFRVLIYEPTCKVWTSRLTCVEAMIVASVHVRCGLKASPVVNRQCVQARVAGLFAAADPRDVGTMSVHGVECRYVRVPCTPQPAKLVTSAAQLAAALQLPVEKVVEVPPPLPIHQVLANATAELARRLGLVPRGKEPR